MILRVVTYSQRVTLTAFAILAIFLIAGLSDGVYDEYDSSNGNDDEDDDDDLTKSGQSRSGWSKVTQSRRLYFTPGDQRAFPHMRKCALAILITSIIIVLMTSLSSNVAKRL